jgi:hypothetical protein
VSVPVAESDGKYKFRLIEGNTSVTSIDQVDLYYIESEPEQEITLDIEGKAYFRRGTALPVRVVDNLGNDITWLLAEEDGNSYVSGNPGYFVAYFEGLPTLNSLAADDPGGNCPDSCGGFNPPPPRKFEFPGAGKVNPDGSDHGEDVLNSNKLDIYVMEGNQWKHVQTLPGSINTSKNIFVPLKEYVRKDGSLSVKCEWSLAYKLDVLEYKHIVKNLGKPQNSLQLASASNQSFSDLRPLLISSDNQQVVLKEGDTISLEFQAPEVEEGNVVELIMRFEGRYGSDVTPSLPQSITLYQNYPNPFNPSTTISFDLAKAAPVRVEVYNLLGQIIKTIYNESLLPGRHQLTWHGDNDNSGIVSSGIYFIRFETEDYSSTRKVMLLK